VIDFSDILIVFFSAACGLLVWIPFYAYGKLLTIFDFSDVFDLVNPPKQKYNLRTYHVFYTDPSTGQKLDLGVAVHGGLVVELNSK